MQILSDCNAMDPEHLPEGQIPQAIRRKGYKHISCAKVHLRSTTFKGSHHNKLFKFGESNFHDYLLL